MAESEQRSSANTKPQVFTLPAIGSLSRSSGLNLGLLNSSATTASTGRLESFRAPRDLSLSTPSVNNASSSKTKKKFEPVIPKNKPKNVNSSAATSSASDQKKVKKEHHIKREKFDRGRNRGRGRGRGHNIIQTIGSVFGEGLAELPLHRFRERSETSSKSAVKKIDAGPKPFFKKEDLAIVEEDDEDVIRTLKRTGFIDDGGDDVKIIGSCPMSVPFRRLVKTFKTEKIKREVKEEQQQPIVINGVTIKSEVKEETGMDVDDDHDVKPDLAMLPPNITVEEILNENMFLLQMPDSLPGHVEAEPEPQPSTSQDAASPSKPSRYSESVPCTLQSLEPGLLGHLEIMASGRARINLGNNRVFYLDVGTSSASKQEVVSIEVDELSQRGRMIALGEVVSRIICTPDWHSELNKIKSKNKS